MPIETISKAKVVDFSNYMDEFPRKDVTPDPKATLQDNLQVGGPLLGLTTYAQNFMAKQAKTIPFVLF